MKDYYFKVASLCKFKKITPIVQSLNTGTTDDPIILTKEKEIEEFMAANVRKEFENSSSPDIHIGNMNPIDEGELM